jgi:hypothetical protein
MTKRTIFAAAVLMAGCVAASAQDVDFVMNSRSEFRGRQFEYSITNEDLKDSPAWDPMAGDPPLSVSRALQLARDKMSYFLTDRTGWEATSIRLTSTSRGKWYYFVSFGCLKPSCADPPTSGFNILVRLDGTVVLPRLVSNERSDRKP